MSETLSKVQSYQPCNLCGDTKGTLFQSKKDDSKNRSEFNRTRATRFSAHSSSRLLSSLVKCLNCKLIRVEPMPSEEFLLEAYSSAASELHAEPTVFRRKSFERAIAKLDSTLLDKGPLKVLDIGCSSGEFLMVMKQFGCSVYGIEPSDALRKIAVEKNGISVFAGTLPNKKVENESFDLVSMWDVLEHVRDPSRFIADASILLDRGGRLLLNIPMIDTLPARLLRGLWPFYLDVHLYYFSMSNLTQLLSKNGFEVEVIRPYFQTLPVGFLLSRYFPSPLIRYSRILNMIPLTYYMGQRTILARKT